MLGEFVAPLEDVPERLAKCVGCLPHRKHMEKLVDSVPCDSVPGFEACKVNVWNAGSVEGARLGERVLLERVRHNRLEVVPVAMEDADRLVLGLLAVVDRRGHIDAQGVPDTIWVISAARGGMPR